MVVTGGVFQDFARGAPFLKGSSAIALCQRSHQPSAISHQLVPQVAHASVPKVELIAGSPVPDGTEKTVHRGFSGVQTDD